MTAAGLREELALDRVASNLREGKIQTEATLVHDTTHYHAYSAMQVVELPEAAQESSPPTGKSITTVKTDGKPVAVARVEVARVPVNQIGEPTAVKDSPTDSPSGATTETDKPVATRKKAEKQAKTTTGKSGKKGQKKRKSHPRVTKNCRCQDRRHCDHAWISADAGAGTVVKSANKMYWGHKASTLCFADQEVLLDAVAMSDAASHDSQSLVPHLSRLFKRHPDLQELVTRVLDDSAADDSSLKASIQEQFGMELLTPINPRRRQPIRDALPRGIDHLTPRGVPVCEAGYPFELLGFRKATERFLFGAPQDAEGTIVCQDCSLRSGCYRGQTGGRVVTISADRVPWLDREFPQLSKRFTKVMADRTSIERIQKLMKFDFGSDRLTKRGNDAFQACLDKTLFAMHILLSHES